MKIDRDIIPVIEQLNAARNNDGCCVQDRSSALCKTMRKRAAKGGYFTIDKEVFCMASCLTQYTL